jgi:hypothetical protein
VSYTPKFVTGCPDCGVSVFLYEGKHYAPLREYLLTGQIIGNDTDIQFRRAYIEHQCLPEDLDRHSQVTEDVVGALKALIEDNPPEWLQGDLQRASKTAKSKYAKLQEITARNGLSRPCPRCNVDVGRPCENLSERKRGNSVPTKNPHEERVPLPGTVEAAELDLAREETSEAYGLLYQIQEALKTNNALEKLLHLAEQC